MKPFYIVGTLVTFLGWIAFMFLCVWGIYQPMHIRVIICVSGLICGILGLFSFMIISSSKTFWKFETDYEKELDKLRESRERYEIAEKAMINATLKGTGVTKN